VSGASSASGGGGGGGGPVGGAGRGWVRVMPLREWALERSHLASSSAVAEALGHVALLSSSLGALVQIVSASVWDNCSSIHHLLRLHSAAQSGGNSNI
jgi:hypothetical protein